MSTLHFRATDQDPVELWGIDSLSAAITGGDIEDWRHIAAAVRADPWGPVTVDLERAIERTGHQGVSAALHGSVVRARREVARSRECADQAGRDALRRTLTTFVERSQLSTEQFADRVRTPVTRLAAYLTGDAVPSAALLALAEQVADDRAANG